MDSMVVPKLETGAYYQARESTWTRDVVPKYL